MELILGMIGFMVFLALAGYGDGITDSGINKPGFHDGGFCDPWHFWSRVQSISAALTGICWMIVLRADTWWYAAILAVPVTPVWFWVTFRFAVYKNGKWTEWYRNEKGVKKAASSLLLRIIKTFC